MSHLHTQCQGDMVTHPQKLSKTDGPIQRNAQLPHAIEKATSSIHIVARSRAESQLLYTQWLFQLFKYWNTSKLDQ